MYRKVKKQESGIVAFTKLPIRSTVSFMHPASKEQVISIFYAGLYLLHSSMGSLRVTD